MTVYASTVYRNENVMKDERIEDIHDLTYLRKYACQRYRYCGQDWYLKCIDCTKKCKAGLQAMVLLDEQTKATEKKVEPPAEPVDKKKQEIIDIFESKDPVKLMLERAGNIKPQSVYARISVMKKNYPDLDKKYHMLEKFRFLYTVPYSSMKIPDILKELYPEKTADVKVTEEKPKKVDKTSGPDKDFHGKYAGIKMVDVASMHPTSIVSDKVLGKPETKVKELPPTEIAPNSKIYSVKVDPKDDGDDIDLESFLAEMDAKEDKIKKEDISAVNEPMVKQEAQKVVRPGVVSEMDGLISELERKKVQLQNQIRQIDEQIKAVQTTKNLMNGFVIF